MLFNPSFTRLDTQHRSAAQGSQDLEGTAIQLGGKIKLINFQCLRLQTPTVRARTILNYSLTIHKTGAQKLWKPEISIVKRKNARYEKSQKSLNFKFRNLKKGDFLTFCKVSLNVFVLCDL